MASINYCMSEEYDEGMTIMTFTVEHNDQTYTYVASRWREGPWSFDYWSGETNWEQALKRYPDCIPNAMACVWFYQMTLNR